MLVIVSHDAGGAELLSSYAKTLDIPYRLVLAGPALSIFRKKLGSISSSPLEPAFLDATCVLTGSSWSSNLEKNAIVEARKRGIHVITYLDYWANYRQRFELGGSLVLPDELWVGDDEAMRIATDTFPGLPVKMVENSYFAEMRRTLSELQPLENPDRSGKTVLYLCEPVREHAKMQMGDENSWGYTEESALEYFLENIRLLGNDLDHVVIRPHPSENPDKYNWVSRATELDVSISITNSLPADLMSASVIAGCQSTALVVALNAGKKVVSCIPPGGKKSSLPHEGILSLQELVELSDH